MTDKLKMSKRDDETPEQAMARVVLTPECLSAAVLVDCKSFGDTPVTDVVEELRRQTVAVNRGNLTRAENMLVAQAHTLAGLLAQLATRAMRAKHMDDLEAYMRLALKAQNQVRATLQTLAELKAPKQVAFVQQANIGQQVQVNNRTLSTRTRKSKKPQNKLLEVEHGERLDIRASSTAGRADPAMATVGEQHRTKKPRR